jgi:pimeloyl-ACP methyl ester carboxylesterase
VTIYRSDEGRRAVQDWCRDRLAAWDQPHRTATISSPIGATHVVTSGNGPDLVLIPGTNFAAATWLDLVAALADRFTVHAVDLPGQPGLSADERTRGGARRHGEWLAAVLTGLDLDGPTVAAHSLGAVGALRATSAGASVGRLVLLDPAGLMRLTVSAAVLRPTLPWLRAPNVATSANLLRMMMAPGAVPEHDLVTWMALVGQHVRTSLAPGPIAPQDLRRIQGTPIRVVSGRHDAFLPPNRLRRAGARRLPAADLEVVPDAGHLLPHERPDAVLAALDL